MGKQSKKKHSVKNKNAAGPSIPQRANPVGVQANGSTHVINRIRHGNITIRHGALTGLSSTLFSPQSLASSHERVKYELIQAVAERIMDSDTPTAICAAGCIGNYALFGTHQIDVPKVGVMVLPIAVSKLKTSIDQILHMQQQCDHICQHMTSSEEAEKHAKRILEKYSLVSLCFNIICALIENTDSDESPFLLNINQTDDFLDVILSTINSTSSILSYHFNSASASIKALLVQESEVNIVGECLYYAMRTLHSCLDDNPFLARKIFNQRDFVFTVLLDTLQNLSLPTLSRLHAAGIVVELANTIPSEQQHPFRDFQTLDDIVIQLILPLLGQYIVFRSDVAVAMMQRIKTSEKELEDSSMDEALEKEVIASVNRQNESARLIARRLAATKETMLTEEKSHQTIHADTPNNQPPRDDSEDAFVRYEKSISAWTNACLPLKLSLEIATNTCTALEQGDEDTHMNEDVDFDSWDEGREKQILLGMKQFVNDSSGPRHSFASKQLLESEIPDIVLTTFFDVFLHCTTYTLNSTADYIPKKTVLDVGDMLMKCSVCLGNILSVVSHWKTDMAQALAVWKRFCQALEEVLRATDTNRSQQAMVIGAITHVLGSLIRFRPSINPLINETELNSIARCVSFGISYNSSPTSDRSGPASDHFFVMVEDIQKDAVLIFGELCRNPHSDELNKRVCDTLINYVRSDANTNMAVMIEIFNVLMDMYSADETDLHNHEKVFRSCDVLSIFMRWVPLLKKRITDEKSRQRSIIDYSIWEETLLNAKRFIHYKKSHS